jgi:hypothetical protein
MLGITVNAYQSLHLVGVEVGLLSQQLVRVPTCVYACVYVCVCMCVDMQKGRIHKQWTRSRRQLYTYDDTQTQYRLTVVVFATDSGPEESV